MNEKQEEKLDKVLEGLAALVPQVADSKSDIRFLRSENAETKQIQARHDERIENLSSDVDEIGKKVRDHVGNSKVHRSPGDAFTDASVRWIFIAKVAGGITAVGAALAFFSQFITP